MNDRIGQRRVLLRGALIGGIALILLAPIPFATTAMADGGGTQKITLFTAIAEPGDDEKIPAKLKPYRKLLLVVSKRFKLEATKHETHAQGKTTTVILPKKLGKVLITDDGKVRSLKIVRDGKTISTSKSNRYPIIVRDPKLKVGGQQVVLILDKGHK
jgi:hypothetical protein